MIAALDGRRRATGRRSAGQTWGGHGRKKRGSWM